MANRIIWPGSLLLLCLFQWGLNVLHPLFDCIHQGGFLSGRILHVVLELESPSLTRDESNLTESGLLKPVIFARACLLFSAKSLPLCLLAAQIFCLLKLFCLCAQAWPVIGISLLKHGEKRAYQATGYRIRPSIHLEQTCQLAKMDLK